MRRYGLFFALLVVLAAAFLAAGTAMLNDSRYDLEVSGTVLAGERSDAGDVSIALDASLESRLKWSAGYDVSTGETVTDSSWDLIMSSGRDIELPSEPALVVHDVGLDLSYSESVNGEIRFESPLTEEIYRDTVLGYGMEAGDRRSVRLNDYTKYVPMRASGHNIVDAGGGEVADYIRIRLSRTVRLMVELDEYWDVSILPAGPDDNMEAGSSLVYTDDWLYFLLNVRGGDGELFDASEMPGGVWSVWRMPCSQRTADDGGTFWLCDFAAMESFYELGEDWQDAYLMLSEDGQRLELFTVEDGDVWLTVLDAGTGSAEQRLLLFPAETAERNMYGTASVNGYVRRQSCEGGYIYTLYDMAAAVVDVDAGRYEHRFSVDTQTAGVPESVKAENVYQEEREFRDIVYDGERLVTLQRVYVYRPNSDSFSAYQLLIYDANGGLVYNEWMENQLSAAASAQTWRLS